MEAPAKQEHFQCWSASKTMNAHCHTRHPTHHMPEANIQIFTASTPSLNGQVPKYECWLQDTGLFHSCSDKLALQYDFPPLYFHSSSNCINMAQQSRRSFLSCPALTESSVMSTWNENLEAAVKTINQPKKIMEYNNAWVTFSVAHAWRWCWHWKAWHLSMTFILQTI